MKALKVLGVGVLFFLLARYFPVIYYTMDFNDFVKQELQRNKVAPQLHKALMDRAQLDFLPLNAEDITIKQDGDMLRVNVDYKVPVNLYVFTHVLSFHAAAAAVLPH